MPDNNNNNEGGRENGNDNSIWTVVVKSTLIFFVANFVFGRLFGGNTDNQQQTPLSMLKPKEHDDVVPRTASPSSSGLLLYPLWKPGTIFNLEMYVSDDAHQVDTDAQPVATVNDIDLKAHNTDITETIQVPISSKVRQNNGTLYAHFFAKREHNNEEELIATDTFHEVRPISTHIAQKQHVKKRNLLSKEEGHEEEQAGEDKNTPPAIVPHYHPNITFAFVDSFDAITVGGLHPVVAKYFHDDKEMRLPTEDGNGQIGYYYPILFDNTFWQLQSQFIELNETTPETVEMNFQLYITVMWKFQMLVSLNEAFRDKQNQGGGAEMEEEVKRVLTETNPYLLGLTMAVSALHTLFEFLALKNDVSHWRGRTDKVGVSLRSIVANVIMQTIILLYLIDNNDSTNSTVLLTQGMGILVEAWKVTKAVNIRFNHNGKWIDITDKHELTETEKKTQEYDEIIFRYMYIAAVPLILSYAGYSLMYKTHKSWYSFIIETLVGSVYAYGFLMLVPSIYINYRLKSVAHMSKKAMTYKFLNTFIDDLFAFVIKMPWLHRLATLRDDVIFIVYLYQTWIYRVDYTRVNDLGQAGPEADAVQEEEPKKDK